MTKKSNSNFDTIIVGAGVAGVMASLKIAEKYKNHKTLMIELGKSPGKRRRQCEGYLGSLPFGDGKLYSNDVYQLLDITSKRTINSASKFFLNTLSEVSDLKIIKDKSPNAETQSKIKKLDFEIHTNDHIQLYPANIHKLSKITADKIDNAPNITCSFDNEVYNIVKEKKNFIVSTSLGEFRSKNVILCGGRSAWRWVNSLYKKFGVIVEDNFARFGMRIELSSGHMKDFNKSHCTLIRDDLQIGPFSWYGSTIPEDHADVVLSAFRSNESRWTSDKVSFNIIGNRNYPNEGVAQTERLAKLAYLLSNDRVGKERIRLFMRNQSQISLLPEYMWLKESLNEISQIIPNIITKGYFHVPAITPLSSKILLSPSLESEIDGLYVAGESSGLSGIHLAATMGIIAADSVCK